MEKAEASDGSLFRQTFELTNIGEPICISEYACKIAGNKSTHVLHINDYQPDMVMQIKKIHIDHQYIK